jgi:hypothetical protein
MPVEAAKALIGVIEAYAALGLLFSLPFLAVGLPRLDESARGTPAGFRLIILPGVVALWPALALTWLRESGGGPRLLREQAR